jgi:hypothetical protein
MQVETVRTGRQTGEPGHEFKPARDFTDGDGADAGTHSLRVNTV